MSESVVNWSSFESDSAVMDYYRPQRSWGKVIFSEACVNNSVHRGGHAWLLGGHTLLLGGMHGCTGGGMRSFIRGACVVLFGGHAWFHSRGMRGFIGGHVWFYSGACVVLLRGHVWFYSGGHA